MLITSYSVPFTFMISGIINFSLCKSIQYIPPHNYLIPFFNLNYRIACCSTVIHCEFDSQFVYIIAHLQSLLTRFF